jgi:glucokinase
MLVGVVGPGPRVLYRENETGFGTTSDEIMARLEAEIRQAIAADTSVEAIGLGIPCTIDREHGIAISAVNLPIQDVPVRDLLGDRLDMPVFVDNDANLAAIAEHRHGAAQGAENVVMLTIGTGIGGGLILNGQPYRGSTGAAAELGHVVVDEDGPPCQGNCPNHGCVETFASGTALAREGREAASREPGSALGRMIAEGHVIDGRAVTDAALNGDEVARVVVERAGYHLGVALSSLANSFDPNVIVIGGGVMAAGDLLLDPARAQLSSRALPPANRTPVVAAALGPDAGMIGAATMALEELERS